MDNKLNKDEKSNTKKNVRRSAVLALALLLTIAALKLGSLKIKANEGVAENTGDTQNNNTAVIDDMNTPLANPDDIVGNVIEDENLPLASAPVETTPQYTAPTAPVTPAAPSTPITPPQPVTGEEVVEETPVVDPETNPEEKPETEPEKEQEKVEEDKKDEEETESVAHQGIAWLVNQLNTTGSNVDAYFKKFNTAGKSLDSNGVNYAPAVNAELEQSGIVTAGSDYGWRIYKGTEAEGYNVFFTDEALVEGETVETSKYNTVSEEMLDGTTEVGSKVVEGNEFTVIDGASFEETPSQEGNN